MADGDDGAVELPQIWQYIHPTFNRADSEEDEEGGDAPPSSAAQGAASYGKLSKSAPRLGKLLRYLNDIEEEEEAQAILLEKDPVSQQTLLQWAVLNDHFVLVEYLVKRLQRASFAFDPEAPEVVVYDRWMEMKEELPNAAEVLERQKQREMDRARRLAERALARNGAEDEDEEEEEWEEEEEEEAEPMPEDVVYESLEDYHGEWGDKGLGIVKRIGALGVYMGPRLSDGTKQGLGQTLFPSGDCYTGEYKRNQREGRGVYWWSKAGAIYAGEWSHNLRHGRGRMIYPDGSRYLGSWVEGRRSGTGRYVYADGGSYDGAWIEDEKHGAGIYHLLDGSTFVGTFHHGQFTTGEWRLASGTSRYVGNFEKGVPVGAGAFVHRGSKGSFQQEGYYADGTWVPNTTKGGAGAAPHVELATHNPTMPRVPMEFAADCAGRTMADLIRVANFAPLQAWIAALPKPSEDRSRAVMLRGVEVKALRISTTDANAVEEVTIRPILVDAVGKRVHLPGETVTLRPAETRLLLILEAPGSGAMVVLASDGEASGEEGDQPRGRLPSIQVGDDARVDGTVVRRLGPALRLELSTTASMAQMEGAIGGGSVWMYAQQVHPDVLAKLGQTLAKVSGGGGKEGGYVAVPLADVAACTSDAATASAISAVQQRSSAQAMPLSTAAPQRPPTPPAPALEPRPALQPLYDAKARRDAAEAEEE